MAANEASAVGSLRTINTPRLPYASNCPAQGFAATLTELNTGATCVAGKDLLDNVLGAAAPKKSGYTFTYTAPTDTPGTNYSVLADAQTQNTSGIRSFFTNESAVIHYKSPGPGATKTDPALQ